MRDCHGEFGNKIGDSLVRAVISFTPFGGGPQLCTESKLAKFEIVVFLHHLLLNFMWEMAKPDQALIFPFIEFHEGLPIRVYRSS